MVCVHFCFVGIWKHKKYTIYPLWPQLMSTSQPSCLRRGLDWCLNKMQQCFPCPRSVHRIPTVPLSPLFWQTRHTKIMQSHGSNGNSDPTFIPLTLTLFLWPWHSYTLSFIRVWGVYTFELSCYILVWFQKKFSLLDMLCACILYLNLLRVWSHQQGGQTRAKSVYWCLQHLFWGRGDREDWRWPPQASPHTAPRLGCFFILYFFFFLEGTGSNYLIISPLPTIPAQSHFGFYTFSL